MLKDGLVRKAQFRGQWSLRTFKRFSTTSPPFLSSPLTIGKSIVTCFVGGMAHLVFSPKENTLIGFVFGEKRNYTVPFRFRAKHSHCLWVWHFCKVAWIWSNADTKYKALLCTSECRGLEDSLVFGSLALQRTDKSRYQLGHQRYISIWFNKRK